LLDLLNATLPTVNDTAGDVLVKHFLAQSQLNATKHAAIVCLTYPQAATTVLLYGRIFMEVYKWDSFFGGKQSGRKV
jgi:hypothetical protein